MGENEIINILLIIFSYVAAFMLGYRHGILS
jgi:uncharacterized membrane protein YqaE (UPF0057 family)